MNSSEAAALKVGDKVFYHEEVVTVARRTATQVVLSNGKRLNKYGRVLGEISSWRFAAQPWTAEQEAAIADRRIRNRNLNTLHRAAWGRMTDETLAAVVALLPKEAS